MDETDATSAAPTGQVIDAFVVPAFEHHHRGRSGRDTASLAACRLTYRELATNLARVHTGLLPALTST
ncbi:hypothetical protein L1080_020260 [Rhodococcus sp. MSC1_016]|jgi:hypothetical protein|uniref:hypothetical protein n=1 Tax=Rhodococcus sp. MSC1_016 TaxID=2909266 RepID=UPI00202E841F|nr:hypothetical protein [Rhodococcus sp. MSC1_016]